MVQRKMAGSVKPTIKITHQGDNFEIEVSAAVRTVKTKFTLGKEFESEVALDHKGKVCNDHK